MTFISNILLSAYYNFLYYFNEEALVEEIRNDGLVIQYLFIKEHTLCELAVQQNGLAMQYITRNDVFSKLSCLGKSHYNPISFNAIQQNGASLEFISPELCWSRLEYYKMCVNAVRMNYDNLKFVKQEYLNEHEYEMLKNMNEEDDDINNLD
jgi:hypothetical protein